MTKVVIGNATLYLGDCMEILPRIDGHECVITDPPYPGLRHNRAGDCYEHPWPMTPPGEWFPLVGPDVRSLVFWPASEPFPLEFTARHIWSKCNILVAGAEPYEAIYEINGKETGLVFRHAVINCEMNATLNGDEYHKHPTQKPIRLMRRLVARMGSSSPVLDPFMGSGTTGVACMNLARHFVGIERDATYFDLACRRIEDAQRQQRLIA